MSSMSRERKVESRRKVKKAQAGAAESKRKGTTRSKVGKVLEKISVTAAGKKAARAIGGNAAKKKGGRSKKGSSNFGGSMSIPKAGGTVSREHGSGFDKTVSRKKPMMTKTGPTRKKS